MTTTGKRSMYRAWNRDTNEKDITAILDRYGVPYLLMPPKAGFDILVFTSPLECWEIKNATYKWTLTRAEHERKTYCKNHGIPYRIIESMEQAVDAITERKR